MYSRTVSIPMGLFLNLLGRSATGQHLTVYTHFLTGPRNGDTLKGPEEMHVILLDNGRIDLINTEYQDVLKCIRCGACQNVCPVYRQSSGHAYRGVYAGPIGAVINPVMFKTEIDDYSDLPFASSLCGACNEVCPVNIPLQDLLVRLRGNPNLTNKTLSKSLAMRVFAFIATSPKIWRLLIRLSKLVNFFPPLLNIFSPLRIWKQTRHLPNLHGLEFRQWYNKRIKSKLSEHSSDYPDYNETIYTSKARLKDNDLVTDFNRNFTSVNGKVIFNIQELVSFLLNNELMFGFCEEHLIELFETELNQKKIYLSPEFNRDRFEKYQFAITPAIGAIAETGSLVLTDSAPIDPLTTICPWVHIGVLKRENIVSSVSEGLKQFQNIKNVTWVTGPSKTADIEGILIEGVHGPGKEICYIINS